MHPEPLLKYPLVFAGAFCVTFLLVPLAAKLAVKLRAVDQPGERRLNIAPVPRLGGLALFAGFHFGCAVIFLPDWAPFAGTLNAHWWVQFLLISTLLLALGVMDDIHELSALTKLLGQLAVASLLYLADFRFGRVLGMNLPGSVDFIVTTIWYLALINAFNLIDGLDGLAAGLACIGATGIAGAMLLLRQPADALVLVALIGACLAFLRFNFYPARIFLGDSGSMFLGLTVAAVAVSTSTKGTTVAVIGMCLLAAGVPLLDTLLAIWRRSVRKMFVSSAVGARSAAVMGGDMDHLHHRLLRLGLKQRGVAVRLWLLSAVLVAVGLLTMVFSSHAVGIFIISFVLATYVVIRHLAHVELWDSGTVLVQGIKRPTQPVMAAILYPVFDFMLLSSALYLALFLVVDMPPRYLKSIWLNLVAQWCSVPFIALIFANTYRRVWSRARVADFVFLAVTLLASIVANLGLTIILSEVSPLQLTKLSITYFFVACTLTIGWRAMPRIVRELMASRGSSRLAAKQRKVLIYGAGDRCSLFLKQHGYASIIGGSKFSIAGLIDDDRNLRKRIVFGLPVLGELADIPAILRLHGVHEIIVACSLTAEKRERLAQIAEDGGVQLSRWHMDLAGGAFAPPTDKAARIQRAG